MKGIAGIETGVELDAAGTDLGPELLVDCVPELTSGVWSVGSLRQTALVKRRRKVFATYDLVYEQESGERTRDRVLVKVYGSDRGANAHRALTDLWADGFRPPASLRVPRPYGYSPERGALAQQQVVGTAWADFLAEGGRALAEASTRAAEWLLALHGSAVEAPSPRLEDAREVARFGSELSSMYPEHGARLGTLAERVAAAVAEPAEAPVPTHGDFHPKNIILEGSAVSVIDFDTFARREAAHDVGYTVAQLLVMSHFRSGSFRRGTEAADTFWRRYAAEQPLPWKRVAAHVGRSLLQSLHFELYTFRNGRTELLTLWPNLIEAGLRSNDATAPSDLLRNG